MSFETEFFGPGNKLRWEAIEGGKLSPETQRRLGPFLSDLSGSAEMLVLPRVKDDGSVIWYIGCQSARVARIARDQIRAFLGPSYSDFSGRLANLSSSDPVEAAVLDRFGRNAFRISVPNQQSIDLTRERLGTLLQLRKEQPVFYAKMERPVGRILRDFEYGLLAGDGSALANSLEELRATGKLSPTNLLFLEIRRLAASHAWDAILTLPEFDSLLSVPRPRGVSEAIIQAIYQSRLAPPLEGNRPTEALHLFRSNLSERFRGLFRTRANLSGFAVDASFVMAALTADPPQSEAAAVILAGYDAQSSEYTLLRSLIDTTALALPSVPPSLESARAAFLEGDIDRCYALAIELPLSLERCSLLLRAAREMSSLAAAEIAIEAFNLLDSADQQKVREHAILFRALQSLTELLSAEADSSAPKQLPGNWTDWIQQLTGDKPWAAAVVVAETGSREWSLSDLLQDGSAIQQLANLLLADRPEWARVALRDSLPYFLKFCFAAEYDVRLRPIYESLFLAVAVDSEKSLPQITALLQIIEYRLQAGSTVSDYTDMLDQLSASIRAIDSPAVIGLGLNALETVISRPCPNSKRRQEFGANLIAALQRWRSRFDRAQQFLLLNLAHELDLDMVMLFEAVPGTAAEKSTWNRLNDKRVAIYSLQESALRRAASVLAELCESAHVSTFSDHVATPNLRVAARQADVFVLVTGAAKHAATTFIESQRPKSGITLYASGQGSSSILQVLRGFLENAY